CSMPSPILTSTPLVFLACLIHTSSTRRTDVYGPVSRVVSQGQRATAYLCRLMTYRKCAWAKTRARGHLWSLEANQRNLVRALLHSLTDDCWQRWRTCTWAEQVAGMLTSAVKRRSCEPHLHNDVCSPTRRCCTSGRVWRGSAPLRRRAARRQQHI